MKIAIHKREGSFSDRWIPYCEENKIPYKIVNCYASDIVHQLADCEGLLWHYHQTSLKDFLLAKPLLFACEAAGKKIFPDFHTAWHFDDKVAQKYLLEGLDLKLVPSHVFYSREEAISWATNTSFPKVFKLRGGAGSQNVSLVRDLSAAKHLIKKAFSSGFNQYDAWGNLKERYRKYRIGKATLKEVAKGAIRLVSPPKFNSVMGKEIGYIYFQDFIPGNDSDFRVVVIGEKAFAIKRMVRPNDFRASGSGFIVYEKENFDDELIQFSFKIAADLKSICVAIDFVRSENQWLIVEISYGFTPYGYDPCVGYWDKNLNFIPGNFNPYGWMIDQLWSAVNAATNKT